jgi:hypothetical protein
MVFIGFVFLCQTSSSYLIINTYFILLLISFFVMVVAILKKGTPSKNTFDQKFYDDADLGPS